MIQNWIVRTYSSKPAQIQLLERLDQLDAPWWHSWQREFVPLATRWPPNVTAPITSIKGCTPAATTRIRKPASRMSRQSAEGRVRL